MVEIKEKGHTFKNKIQAFHTSHTWSVSSFWEISPQEIIPLLLEISKFFIRIRSKQQVLNINPFIISGYLANPCLLKGVSSNAYCTTSCSQLPTLNLLADVALNDGKATKNYHMLSLHLNTEGLHSRNLTNWYHKFLEFKFNWLFQTIVLEPSILVFRGCIFHSSSNILIRHGACHVRPVQVVQVRGGWKLKTRKTP